MIQRTCSQREFARCVGLSPARVNQLKNAGLLPTQDGAIVFIESLRRYYEWRILKKYHCTTVAEYVRSY